MSHQRSELSLADEAARHRRNLREEESRHAITRASLDEANRRLLAMCLREHLADPRDFELHIKMSAVVDSRGRIVWTRVGALLAELLQERPHLAAPRDALPWNQAQSTLEWFATGT